MAGSMKMFLSKAALIGFVIALAVQIQGSEAQGNCANELSTLNVCAPFVVPGASNTNPSADCCGALQAVDHECLCNTLRVASRLPSSCNLPALACGN